MKTRIFALFILAALVLAGCATAPKATPSAGAEGVTVEAAAPGAYAEGLHEQASLTGSAMSQVAEKGEEG